MFGFTASATADEATVGQRIVDAFAGKQDSGKRDFSLAQPIPQSESVGPQVENGHAVNRHGFALD